MRKTLKLKWISFWKSNLYYLIYTVLLQKTLYNQKVSDYYEKTFDLQRRGWYKIQNIF